MHAHAHTDTWNHPHTCRHMHRQAHPCRLMHTHANTGTWNYLHTYRHTPIYIPCIPHTCRHAHTSMHTAYTHRKGNLLKSAASPAPVGEAASSGQHRPVFTHLLQPAGHGLQEGPHVGAVLPTIGSACSWVNIWPGPAQEVSLTPGCPPSLSLRPEN